jgi:hypothetical protein
MRTRANLQLLGIRERRCCGVAMMQLQEEIGRLGHGSWWVL